MASSSFPSFYTSLSPPFTPIPEEDDEQEMEATTPYEHHPTPLQNRTAPDNNDRTVGFNKCRPSSREKTTIVPVDINCRFSSFMSPNYNGTSGLKTFLSSLAGKSPSHSSVSSSSSNLSVSGRDRSDREQDWKLVAAEMSRNALYATKKRDEALAEASRLKHCVSELEKKLTRLEAYCHDLKYSLDHSGKRNGRGDVYRPVHVSVESSFPTDAFLRAVSEARSSVRHLSRSLVAQIRQSGPAKTLDRIALLLQPYDVRLSSACKSNPKSIISYLEALLNRAFYEDFESSGFQCNGSDRTLDPFARCESNRAAYKELKGLSWEDVKRKGTWHYSEGLSGFCDRKMSMVAGMLGWERVGPEPLLQALFGAAKGIWLVHLLARSVHPALPLFRVGKGDQFDSGYMEEVVLGRVQRLETGTVQMMVAPGFYVFSNIIKCTALCTHNNINNNNSEK